jgi:hypothetical protein
MKMEREHLYPSTDSTYTYDSVDKEIISRATQLEYPQTEYQCNNFVSGSHATLYRRIKQTALEIQSREHAIAKNDIGTRRCEIELRKAQKRYEEEQDPFEKELIEVQIDDLKLDLDVWHKKGRQAHIELRYFLNYIKQYVSSPDDIEKAMLPDPEEEHKYWIARMAKQSTVDILTQGRIGAGNLDSILMMNEEDQVATMQLALDYSSALGVGLHNLRLNAEEKTKAILDGKQIPSISYLEQVKTQYDTPEKLLQSTYQSETQS